MPVISVGRHFLSEVISQHTNVSIRVRCPMYVINVGRHLLGKEVSKDTNTSTQVRSHMYVINVGMHLLSNKISLDTNASTQARSHIIISVRRPLFGHPYILKRHTQKKKITHTRSHILVIVRGHTKVQVIWRGGGRWGMKTATGGKLLVQGLSADQSK